MRAIGIGKKFSVITILFIVLFSISVLVCCWRISDKVLTSNLADTVKAKSELLNNNFEEMKRRAYSATEWFESSARLVKAVKENNRQEMLKTGKLAMESLGFEYFVITDNQGNVLARAHEPEKFGDSIANQANIQKALKGERSVGVEEGAVVKFSIRAGTPLKDTDGKIIGAISLGYVLSGTEFVDRQKKQFDFDITVFQGNERIATTLESGGKRIVGTQLENQTIIDAVLNKGTIYYGDSTILGKYYHTVYMPLKDVNGKIAGMFFIGQDASIVNELIYKLNTNIGFLIAAIGILLIVIMALVVRSVITSRINKLTAIMKEIAEGHGDLTRRIQITSEDEIGVMAEYFNKFVHNIHDIVKSVTKEAGIIEVSLTQADASMKELDERMLQINTASEELSAEQEETAVSVTQLNDTAADIEKAAEFIAKRAQDGSKTTSEINLKAKELNSGFIISHDNAAKMMEKNRERLECALQESQSVEKIKVLTDVILEITSQTNLLALNAAIEAARAGEAGKGFSVVAEEIRKLADISRKTATEIVEATKTITGAVNNLSDSSNEMLEFVSMNVDQDYKMMLNAVGQYSQDASVFDNIITDFSAVSEELLASVQTVASSIAQVTTATNEGANETNAMAQNLSDMQTDSNNVVKQLFSSKESSIELRSLVSKFKVT